MLRIPPSLETPGLRVACGPGATPAERWVRESVGTVMASANMVVGGKEFVPASVLFIQDAASAVARSGGEIGSLP